MKIRDGGLSKSRRCSLDRLDQRLRRERLCEIGEATGFQRRLVNGGGVVSREIDYRPPNTTPPDDPRPLTPPIPTPALVQRMTHALPRRKDARAASRAMGASVTKVGRARALRAALALGREAGRQYGTIASSVLAGN